MNSNPQRSPMSTGDSHKSAFQLETEEFLAKIGYGTPGVEKQVTDLLTKTDKDIIDTPEPRSTDDLGEFGVA